MNHITIVPWYCERCKREIGGVFRGRCSQCNRMICFLCMAPIASIKAKKVVCRSCKSI